MKPPPARAAAGEADHGVDRRVAADDVDELAQLLAHRLRRDALVGAQAAVELAGVLLREEALGDGAEEVDVEADHARPGSASPASRWPAPSRGCARSRAARGRSRARPSARARPGWLSRRRAAGCSSQAHIIGVVVSEITSEIITAADSVTANSRNSRPTWPPMNSSGMNTATSDRLIDSTVKPTSRAPSSAACEAVHAGLDVAAGVLEHHDRVVDHEAGRHRQRHQAQVVEREAEQVHHAEGAEQRDDGRHRRDRWSRARCAGRR